MRALVVICALLCIPAARLPAANPPPAPFPVTIDPAQDEFALIVVPDTQRYALWFPHIFRSQFQWIRDSIARLNVKYVIHVGDIVDNDTEAEWKVADDAFALIDGLVPYIAVPGNHDLDAGSGKAGFRSSTRYNALFSPKRFQNRSWYGGNKGVTGDNSFGYFEAAGKSFMVLGIEFGPSDETLEWAAEVSKVNKAHHILLVTHCYLMGDDTRNGPGDDFNPHTKFGPAWNDGEDIWEKLVRKSASIRMVLSGHVCDDGAGCLVSKNDAGNPVIQMVANYQFMRQGGQGWLRILAFRPRKKTLDVHTYSPWLNAFREEKDQRFSVDISSLFP